MGQGRGMNLEHREGQGTRTISRHSSLDARDGAGNGASKPTLPHSAAPQASEVTRTHTNPKTTPPHTHTQNLHLCHKLVPRAFPFLNYPFTSQQVEGHC